MTDRVAAKPYKCGIYVQSRGRTMPLFEADIRDMPYVPIEALYQEFKKRMQSEAAMDAPIAKEPSWLTQ